MSFNNARDSYVDLLEIKAQKEKEHQWEEYECGELCDPQDDVYSDESWPMWEMTGKDPWSDELSGFLAGSSDDGPSRGLSDYGNVSIEEGSNPSIADCERIFTVPEVYNELHTFEPTFQSLASLIMRGSNDSHSGYYRGSSQDCQLLNCLAPWKNKGQVNIAKGGGNNAFVDGSNRDEQDLKPQMIRPDDDGHIQQEGPKGVIKRTSMAVQAYTGMPASVRKSFTPSMFKVLFEEEDGSVTEQGEGARRNRVSMVGFEGNKIFSPEAEESKVMTPTIHPKKMYRVHFSEVKRVLKIRKLTPDEALEVWFQREDFDHFKAEMTLLIQEEEASREMADFYLDAKEVERRRSGSVSSETDKRGSTASTDTKDSSTSHTKSRSWWHDYEHSRRGLERYASPGQARQILASYRVAMQKVLAEQRRQKLLQLFCVPYADNPEKIAEIYHEYTAWSRDLALAAGASDADAVKTNFDDEKRKTREYYILKQVIGSGYKVHKHMPQFMLPKCITPKGFLDEGESLYYPDEHPNVTNKRDGVVSPGLGADEGAKRRTSLVQSLIGKASSVNPLRGGEQARSEMSDLKDGDVEGPVAPALAPALNSKKSTGSENSKTKSGGKSDLFSKKTSMAKKATNFPFQE